MLGSWVLPPVQFVVWAIAHLPVTTPHDGDVQLLRRFLHGRCDLVIQGPGPVDLVVHPSPKIDRVAGDVPRVEGLACTGLHERLLARRIAQTFEHREVHRGDLDGTLDHLDQIRMHAFQTTLGAWAEFVHAASYLAT